MSIQHSAGPDLEDAKRKRRAIAQGQKACDPCRMRKVKCSYQLPCQICVERDHPELCVYGAPQKRVWLGPTPDLSAVSPSMRPWPPSEEEWEALCGRVTWLEHAVQGDQTKGLSHASAPHEGATVSIEAAVEAELSQDMYSKHPLTGETFFLGANSVPAMAVALSRTDDSDAVQSLLDKSMLPIFALENQSATYPFVDLWGLPHSSRERIERLCALLPTDAECLQYLRQYRDTAHVLFPGIVHMQEFETAVTQFLMARTMQSANPRRAPLTEQDVYGRSVHWLGLLFAALASGCQCSTLQRKERQLTSQVYVCCAYECLRITNYLSSAQLDDIQNLLILGNVISNSMNAGVAWALLGLTIRLAQGLGLHRAYPSHASTEEDRMRFEVWSRIIWQDSLLSITYDRATSTTSITQWVTLRPSTADGFSYAECMLKLCVTALDIVSSRAAAMNTYREVMQIEERLQQILAIERQESAHLRNLADCASMTHHLEHWNWRMHRSYVLSELCRPLLTKRKAVNEATKKLRSICIEALTETVAAFLNLHNLTTFALTSWAAVYRSLSSALLLGILKNLPHGDEVQLMLDNLVSVMSTFASEDSSEVPAPITRGVAALARLKVDVSVEVFVNDPGSTDSSETSPHAQMHNILWGGSYSAS